MATDATKRAFYHNLLVKTEVKEKKKEVETNELKQLYKTPKKDTAKETPRNRNITTGAIYQADCLYMPHDGEYKFMLVCVDTANGGTDAIPLKQLTQEAVIEGFKKIFNGKYLKEPTYLQVDAGVEFTGKTLKFLNDKKIMVKVSKVARSRQASYAESRNKTLARALFMRMTGQELITNEVESRWVEDLPFALEAINENAKRVFEKKKKKVEKADKPVFTAENRKLLRPSTKVRIILDKPKGVAGDKLTGAFRATDTRWSTEVYTIGNIILENGQPPMYLVKNPEGKYIPAGYTRNQLQVVGESIEAPKAEEVLRGKPEQYVIEKIVEKKVEKGKAKYRIRWKGFTEKDDTWEGKEIFTSKPLKKMLSDYNDTH